MALPTLFKKKGVDREFAEKLLPLVRALRLYHRHEVRGLEKVPRTGSLIIATNHSLATYDIALLMGAVYEETQRFPRSLIDHAFYKIPYLGELMEKTGSVAGTQENARKLLHEGELLYLAPGGMREALRPSNDRYRILWERRRGFARLSFETGAPIVLAACPRSDEIYDVLENPFTKLIYNTFRLPFFLAKGVGFSPLPKPVPLLHVISEPIYPPAPKGDEHARQRQLQRYHKKLVTRMATLMEQALAES